ncbi:MAG: hypothetical protein JWN25_2585 [Verrucomicrobiales bacterium]|nr:hypothetical protein [Verrucomicrobiales bacterium]
MLFINPVAAMVTLEDLRGDANLTPKKFAAIFRNFRFVERAEVQEFEVFLISEAGDCDDYAILASVVLGEKGYHPKLVTIRMPGATHVVCYIAEEGAYLDYNLRGGFRKMEKCSADLSAIADKVAKSFDASWTTASEFTWDGGIRKIVTTVSKIKSSK